MEHRSATHEFWNEIVETRTPRGALQAAEFEDRKLGNLIADGRTVAYVDVITGATLLSWSYQSVREAKSQLDFFRSIYTDVTRRRAALHVV